MNNVIKRISFLYAVMFLTAQEPIHAYQVKKNQMPPHTKDQIAKLVRSLNNNKVSYNRHTNSISISPDVNISANLSMGILFLIAGILASACDSRGELAPIGIPMCIIGVLALIYAKIKTEVLGAKTAVKIDERNITYQNCGVFWDDPQHTIPLEKIKNIETRIRTWIETEYSCASSYNSNGSSTTISMPHSYQRSARDIVLRAEQYWKSIFIPENDLPLSFEEFYDLVTQTFMPELAAS